MNIFNFLKRFLIVLSFTFFVAVIGILIYYHQALYIPRSMLGFLIIISGLISLLSFIYVGYSKNVWGLVWRTAIHYSLLLIAAFVGLYLFTEYPFTFRNILRVWFLFTGVYAIGWAGVFLYGLIENRQLNAGLKAYRLRREQEQKPESDDDKNTKN